MKVSIIIPYRTYDKYVHECLEGIKKLNFKDYEVILLPDEKTVEKEFTVIETGKVKPSLKRNIGVEKSKNEIIAFIDSDAYPRKDWLSNGLKCFDDLNVGIVGGPNLTPKNSNIWEKISGDVLSMFICSGKAAIRYKIGNKKEYVDELPSCNLLIRKEDFFPFDESLLTAEDTKLCFQVVEKGKKILYSPDVVVYHHRRDSFSKHLLQMFIYGRDIASLLKKKFSFDKLYYSVLSLFVGYLVVGGVVSFFSGIVKVVYLSSLLLYFGSILLLSIFKDFRRSLLLFITVVLTHISYGIGFIWGLF
jgi:cellulose synthase/poly-beta-1,6-N-acetylglucosamine synthase-like glycosyltransferase